jgi:tetratricopeptide (TPR) repeat protein
VFVSSDPHELLRRIEAARTIDEAFDAALRTAATEPAGALAASAWARVVTHRRFRKAPATLRAKTMTRFGMALLDEYVAGGDAELGDAAVNAFRVASDAVPEGSRSWTLGNLALAHATRYSVTGDRVELSLAVETYQAAIQYSTEPTERGRASNSLAIALIQGWERTRDAALLDDAITEQRRALALADLPPELRAELASNMGAGLFHRYEIEGADADLVAAVEALATAIEHMPATDRRRDMYLSNAATAVHRVRAGKFSGTSVAAVAPAVELQRRLIAARAEPDPGELTILAHLLHDRYDVSGRVEDLDEGIEIGERAATACPERSAAWARAWGAVAGLLTSRVDHRAGVEDLDRAIDLLHSVLAGTPADAPERPGYLNVLGVAFRDRHARTGNPEDLAAAGRAHREAVDASAEDDPLRSQFERNLALLDSAEPDPVSIPDLADQVQLELLTEETAHDLVAALTGPAPGREIDTILDLVRAAADGGDVRRAYLLASLLFTRTAQAPGDRDGQVTLAYLDAVCDWVTVHPDQGLLAEASEVALDLADGSEQTDPRTAVGALVAAADLAVWPVYGQWRGDDLAGARERWRAQGDDDFWVRPRENVDSDAEASIEAPDAGPLDDAHQARRLLERALPLARGQQRGTVLRKLAAVDVLAAEFGDEDADPSRHAREALRFLDRAEDAGNRISLWYLLVGQGERPDAIPEDLLPRPWPSIVELVGAAAAPGLAYTAARALGMLGAEEEVRDWLEVVRPHIALATPVRRQQIWALEGHHLRDDVLECPEQGVDVTAAAEGIKQLAADVQLTPAQTATALLHLAYHGHSSEQFDAGLALLNEASEMAPDLPDLVGPVHLYIAATLSGAAATGWANRGELETAALGYASAANALVALGLRNEAIEALDRLVRCAADAPSAMPIAARHLSVLVPRLLIQGDTAALPGLLALCRRAVAAATDAESALRLHQVVKGVQFAVAVAAAGPVPADSDDARLLAGIREAEQHLGPDLSAVLAGVGVDDEMLMSSYIGLAELASGRTPQLAAANLERYYDRTLAGEVLRGRADADPYLTLADVQGRLPGDSALVSVVLGDPDSGQIASVVVVTRDSADVHLMQAQGLSVPLVLLLDDYTVQMHAWGPLVARLRRAVRDDPLLRPVTRDGERHLETAHSIVPAEVLASLRAAGKTHLCFWPHGPLHLLPFHLLGLAGRPLADDWTVTVVPGLRLAGPPAVHDGPRTLLSVGCAGGGLPYGLAVESSVERQALAVAETFGGRALVAGVATVAEVLRAAPGVRYLHLAAHGSINEIAPVFQCVYLAPGRDGADGRLSAHDILRLDLRGVDIVTLSTCESALGRIDLGDNPHGLPAALFTVGVQTIVGCLWPVHPDPAELFFCTFYEWLGRDEPRLAAFRGAQLATRERHPQYRDWGAFTMIGRWEGAR